MKSIMPWLCLIASTTVQAAVSTEGLENYRQGNYLAAAAELAKQATLDPVVDYYLGRMRLYGYGQLKNNTLAIKHFSHSGEKGYLAAQNIMARYNLLKTQNLEQALYWFKKAAAANDVQAQMYCAAAYLFGLGTKPNEDIARKYYIDAARNGDAIAQFTLGEHFIDSRSESNKKLGLIWLNKAVEKGNPKAQIKMAELYAKGSQVEQSLESAKQLITAALKSNYLPAYKAMGDIALQNKDYLAAKNWYLQGAQKNSVSAQMALASFLMQANTAFTDVNTGYLWMLKAAENGSVDAQRYLAKIYQEGTVKAKDEHLAKEWLRKAELTERGNPKTALARASQWLSNGKASNMIASGYGISGIFSDWENPKSLKENTYNAAPKMDIINRETLYKPKFAMVNPESIAINEYYDAIATSLGDLRLQEFEFPKYEVKPLVHFQQAKVLIADSPLKNTADLQTQYPIISKDKPYSVMDDLVENKDDDSNAIVESPMFGQLHEQAILGDPEAEFALAQRYQYGIDTKKDIEEAIEFYQRAAGQKDLRAMYNLGILYLTEKDYLDYQEGLNWLNNAAFKGNAKAQYVLGQLTEKGYKDAAGKQVLQPDPEQAVSFYYIASVNKLGKAQYRLAETLVRDKQADMSVSAKQQRLALIKRLYEGAVAKGVDKAQLPLAFFNAMESDKVKQQKAFEEASRQAKAGNGDAALLLGLLYDRGIGVEASKSKALEWYQKASANPVSSFILGTYLSQGESIGKDMEQGKNLLKKSADAGFSYANLNLAVLKQQQGENFLAELDAARAMGNSTAGLLLADYYLSKEQNPELMKQSRDIYQHFAEKGDKQAQLKLAYMLEQGLGGASDPVAALSWYTKSAEQGDVQGQYLLGHFYQLGKLNNQPDYGLAKHWYQAAEAKYAPAAVALGFIYDTVDDNYQQAAAAYQIAANQKDPIGQYNLALIYDKGKGRPVDVDAAKALYTKAAEAGQTASMTQLADLYFDKPGSSSESETAIEWYKKAASKGDREALYHLGLLSETGVGTDLDYTAALQYYQKSADLGNEKAMLALARMYQFGLGVAQNKQEAAKIYQSLVAKNNPFAQYQLAGLYLEGAGVARSPEEAKHMLLLSQENGGKMARQTLQRMGAQTQLQTSYLEPVRLNVAMDEQMDKLPVNFLFMDAMNAWNRGDEIQSKYILNRIVTQFPKFDPAKQAYEQLTKSLQVQASI